MAEKEIADELKLLIRSRYPVLYYVDIRGGQGGANPLRDSKQHEEKADRLVCHRG